VASWNWRIEFEGLMAIAEALRNSAPTMANRALPGPVDLCRRFPQLAQRGVARVQQFFDDLNAHLAHREFVATGQFSVADISSRGGGRLRPRGQASSRATGTSTCVAGATRWRSARRSACRPSSCTTNPARRPTD
jgi:glutathione S-transferase